MNRKIENLRDRTASPVIRLSEARASEAVAVLCDAFHDYPVMRYILGAGGRDYERHLQTAEETATRRLLILQ